MIPARLPAGIINGVSTVSRDSCLYAESFATREVLQRIRGANLTRVATGLDYYFGVINIAPENVTQEIFGFDTNSIQASLETTQAQSALALLNTTGVATLLNSTDAQVGVAGSIPMQCMLEAVALLPPSRERGKATDVHAQGSAAASADPDLAGYLGKAHADYPKLGRAGSWCSGRHCLPASSPGQPPRSALQAVLETQNLTSAQILALPTDVSALNASLGNLDTVVSRSAFTPAYLSAKQLLCCRLTHAAHELWLSWMITGVLAAVLAIVLTIQVCLMFLGSVWGDALVFVVGSCACRCGRPARRGFLTICHAGLVPAGEDWPHLQPCPAWTDKRKPTLCLGK